MPPEPPLLNVNELFRAIVDGWQQEEILTLGYEAKEHLSLEKCLEGLAYAIHTLHERAREQTQPFIECLS